MAGPLSKLDHDLVRSVVHQTSGIVLEEAKGYLIDARLAALAKKEGLTDCSQILTEMKGTPGKSRYHEKVVEALTTNETSFFRDQHPFDGVRAVVVPDLLRKRAVERRLTVWCAAAAAGQEPYSLAMLLKEHFAPQLAGWTVRLLATDISTQVLDQARAGLYTPWEVHRGLPPEYLRKYFKPHGVGWAVRDDIKAMVEFRPFNLLDPFAAIPPCDVVLMRNVLIYFDLDTKRAILDKVRRVLRPDGYLFLGGAETTMNIDNGYDRVPTGPTVTYRPRAAASAGSKYVALGARPSQIILPTGGGRS
jgi:chemotaxis protein methyltransferase CheR